MFEKIFIEKDLADNEIENVRVLRILKKLNGNIPRVLIDKYTDIFEKVKKPYLQKRNNLNLFLAKKRGELVKLAPDAYGYGDAPHYYFFHSLNCIYECKYCYLQGYFNSPDIVYFINFEDVGNQITSISEKCRQTNESSEVWFHMGEFSDSLALSALGGDDISYYFKLFETLPDAYLELRTKSINIGQILKEKPLSNVIVSFTLGPDSLDVEKKIADSQKRINAMAKLYKSDYKLGLHLDPIIYHDNYLEHYGNLIKNLSSFVPLDYFSYISIGVVRYSKDSYRQVKLNYPDSMAISNEFITSFDGKIRYPRAIRLNILNSIKNILQKEGASFESIYLCME